MRDQARDVVGWVRRLSRLPSTKVHPMTNDGRNIREVRKNALEHGAAHARCTRGLLKRTLRDQKGEEEASSTKGAALAARGGAESCNAGLCTTARAHRRAQTAPRARGRKRLRPRARRQTRTRRGARRRARARSPVDHRRRAPLDASVGQLPPPLRGEPAQGHLRRRGACEAERGAALRPPTLRPSRTRARAPAAHHAPRCAPRRTVSWRRRVPRHNDGSPQPDVR